MLRFVTTPNATCGRCPEWDESRLRPALVRAGCFFPHRCKEHAVFFSCSSGPCRLYSCHLVVAPSKRLHAFDGAADFFRAAGSEKTNMHEVMSQILHRTFVCLW